MRIRLATAIKLLGFTLGSLMAVLMALSLLVWISFDAGRAAATLTQHFHERYDRNLKLATEPRLEIWPRPSLLLDGVTLSEPAQTEVFASAGGIRAELALLPLLTRRVELRRVVVEAPQIRLRLGTNGKWNFADLLGTASTSASANPIDLSSVSLQDGTIKFEGLAAVQGAEIRQLYLLANKLGESLASEISIGGRWVDAPSSSDARLDIRATASTNDGQTTIDAVNAHLAGNMFGLRGASIRATATHIAWNNAGHHGEVSRVSARLTGAKGTEAIEFSGELPALSWNDSVWNSERSTAKLILRAPGEESTFTMEIAGLKDSAGKATAPLDLKWENKGAAMVGTGQFNGLLVVEAQAGRFAIEEFKGSARRVPLKNNRPGGETRISAGVQWLADASAKQPGVFDLDLADGPDSLRLRGRFDRLQPLRGTLQLDSPRLNADRLFTTANRERFGAWFAPLATQVQLDADLNLLNLRLAGVRTDSLRASMRIAQGRAIATKAHMSLYGGSAELDADAELPAGNISVRGEYKGVDFEALVRDSRWPLNFVGEQTGSFDINATHQSGNPDLASLRGALRWTQKGGALQGIDLAQSLREFHTAIRNKSVITRQAGNRESTELTNAAGRYVFDQGTMRAARIEASNKWLSLVVPGTVDLARGDIDYQLGTRVKGGGSDIADLRAKPLALHLLGPARKPQLHYEPAGKKAAQ